MNPCPPVMRISSDFWSMVMDGRLGCGGGLKSSRWNPAQVLTKPAREVRTLFSQKHITPNCFPDRPCHILDASHVAL